MICVDEDKRAFVEPPVSVIVPSRESTVAALKASLETLMTINTYSCNNNDYIIRYYSTVWNCGS